LPQRGKTKEKIMADTYPQIFYHVVFAVRNREALITDPIKNDLHKYISGIISNQGQKLFIINGSEDHVHLLMNCKPNMNLSDNIREIKEHSSKFINSKKILRGQFYWQAGFGAYSVSKKDVSFVLNYIKNQEEHHKKTTFREEYLEFLKMHEIEFKEEYLFDFDLK
jgi:putative transposase